MKNFIYFRGLKKADHTVFCVQNGQKFYYDSIFKRKMPFSSGQQVKRCIIEKLSETSGAELSPTTFNYVMKDNKLAMGEPWSSCNPIYIDQLIGGYMKIASKKGDEKDSSMRIKRRSPLSISALRAIHPYLSGMYEENVVFNRNNRKDNKIIIKDEKGKELTEKEIKDFLTKNSRDLPAMTWIPDDKRAQGLFIYDVAIDLRRLFCVNYNIHEQEFDSETEQELLKAGWIKSKNVFGECLVLPKKERENLIPAIADAIINWRIESNQSRTFSLMETLAIAISTEANNIPNMIYAELDYEKENSANLILDNDFENSSLFVTPTCKSIIKTEISDKNAIEKAKNELIKLMIDFKYE